MITTKHTYEESLKNYIDFRESLRTAVEERVFKIIKRGLKKGLSPEDISDLADVPLETVLKIQKTLTLKPS